MNNNPWAVNSVQAFSCLKCPECAFNTNHETFFQDHAVENHPLSIALFGKIKSLYISSVLFGEETEDEKSMIFHKKFMLNSATTITMHERFTQLRNRKSNPAIKGSEKNSQTKPRPSSFPQEHFVSQDQQSKNLGHGTDSSHQYTLGT